MWERVEKEKEGIDAAVCQNLIESMSKRIEATIKAKGTIPSIDMNSFVSENWQQQNSFNAPFSVFPL